MTYASFAQAAALCVAALLTSTAANADLINEGDFTLDTNTGVFLVMQSPAVPELPAWNMMLVGFACLGLAGLRRRIVG